LVPLISKVGGWALGPIGWLRLWFLPIEEMPCGDQDWERQQWESAGPRNGVRIVCTGVREYVIFVFFSDLKKHDFLRFFEMTYQKVISKSLVLNTSPRSDHFAQ